MLTKEIGETAGTVWTHLAKNGKTSFADLMTRTKTNPEMLNRAIGWLARENKVCLDRDAKNSYVCLTDDETKKYKPTGGATAESRPERRGDDYGAECGARV